MTEHERHGAASISAWEKARAYGIDMSLIEANLRKTPLQRIRNHARALASATQLREAMGKRHARP